MSGIRTKINAVTNYRLEWYDTPGGPKQMHCACNPYVPCLYHYYVLQNPGYVPRRYSHEPVITEPVLKRVPGKQRPQTGVPSRPGARPGKPSRKPQKAA